MKARLEIKPQTWKRTRGGGKVRYMDEGERAYYMELEAALRRAGFVPYPPAPLELSIILEFHTKDRRWRDIDNLEKAILDAGQPSKWILPKSHRKHVTDLWDDKQFRLVFKRRFRGSTGDYIIIEVIADEDKLSRGGDEG